MLNDEGGACGSKCPYARKENPEECTGPPDGPGFIAPCFVCHGADEDCPECKGENRIELAGCPRKCIRPEHEDAIGATLRLELGILPAPGAWFDQAATFVQAWPLLAGELASWRQILQKRAQPKGG